MSKHVTIEIETAIRRQSWVTAQVGRKSLQRLIVDFQRRTVAQEFLTGTTKIACLELGSIRDNFALIKPRFNEAGKAYFSVSGETASAVGVMPNINYSFDFEVSSTEVQVSGSHDGYPSYNVAVNGNSVYDYVQGYLWQLAGDADIQVARQAFRF